MIRSTLSVLVGIALTDAMIVSSTAAENDYAAWSSLTTYATGDRRISTVTHRIYESLKDGNTGKDPTDITNRTGSTVWWLDLGPTNKHAMFDGEVGTQTSVASPLTVVLRPGFFNSFYLGGLDADNIEYTVRDAPGGNIVTTYSGSLEGSAPPDYYEHWFDRFKPRTDLLVSGIDQYNDAEITVKLSKASGLVKCGVLVLGDLRPLAATMYGAKAKPKTYSYIDIDPRFGTNKIQRGKKSKDVTLSGWLKLEEANSVIETLQELLDVPCVWVGHDLPEYGGLRVFGLGSGEVSYDHPKDCLLTVEVQGLI